MRTRPAREASDYFVRQGTDADTLAAELTTANSAGGTSPRSTRRASGRTREHSTRPPSSS